jgi:hypothetical protein
MPFVNTNALLLAHTRNITVDNNATGTGHEKDNVYA